MRLWRCGKTWVSLSYEEGSATIQSPIKNVVFHKQNTSQVRASLEEQLAMGCHLKTLPIYQLQLSGQVTLTRYKSSGLKYMVHPKKHFLFWLQGGSCRKLIIGLISSHPANYRAEQAPDGGIPKGTFFQDIVHLFHGIKNRSKWRLEVKQGW